MRAIKLEAVINENHEINIKLPNDVKVGRAEVLVLFDEQTSTAGDQRAKTPSREFGQFRGKIKISDDFDQPLPDDFWLGGKS